MKKYLVCGLMLIMALAVGCGGSASSDEVKKGGTITFKINGVSKTITSNDSCLFPTRLSVGNGTDSFIFTLDQTKMVQGTTLTNFSDVRSINIKVDGIEYFDYYPNQPCTFSITFVEVDKTKSGSPFKATFSGTLYPMSSGHPTGIFTDGVITGFLDF